MPRKLAANNNTIYCFSKSEYAKLVAKKILGKKRGGGVWVIEREGVAIQPAGDLGEAVGQSDVVITITPSRAPVIRREWVRPGTHFSCIGADMEGKEELDPELFRDARVFADDIDQCLRVGELELPVKQGIITREQVAGEIGQVLAGTLPGRTDPEQTTIFDATGLALLDLVTGKRAIEAAARAGKGLTADI